MFGLIQGMGDEAKDVLCSKFVVAFKDWKDFEDSQHLCRVCPNLRGSVQTCRPIEYPRQDATARTLWTWAFGLDINLRNRGSRIRSPGKLKDWFVDGREGKWSLQKENVDEKKYLIKKDDGLIVTVTISQREFGIHEWDCPRRILFCDCESHEATVMVIEGLIGRMKAKLPTE